MASPSRSAAVALVGLSLSVFAACNPGGSAIVATSAPVPEPTPLPGLSLQLHEPATDEHLQATANVHIVFGASDPLAKATIHLMADRDGDPATRADQYELASLAATEHGAMETVDMPLPVGMPVGSYVIVGTIGDGERTPVVAKAPGRIVVEAGPPDEPPTDPRLGLQLLEPATNRIVSRGGPLTLTFTTSGTAGTAEVRFVSDTDGDASTTTDQHPLALLSVTLGGPAQALTVSVDGVPAGVHHVLGLATTANGASARATASGLLQVDDVAFAAREGNSTYEEGRAVATLPDKSLVVVGRFAGSTTFGTWPAVHHLNSLGDDDIFLCRYLADGSLSWARRAGGPSRGDWANAVAANADGSFTVGGFFNGLAAFDGGAATTGLLSAGDDDAFVARYAGDGTLLWARRAGGIFRDEVLGLATLPDGSSIATGSFTAQAIFGEGSQSTTLLVQGSLITADGFVAKYDGNGILAWVRQFGGADGDDAGRSVAVGADGSCVVTGVFRGTVTFGAGAAQVTLLSAGGADVFVAKYDASGNLLWARRGGGAADDEARGIAVCADGAIVAVGGFRGAAGFADALQPIAVQAIGGLDAFAARYAADGSLSTVRVAGSTAEDEARGVAATADGGCIVTGHFQTAASFTGGVVPQNLVGFGARDIFVARYTNTGALAWIRPAGGTDVDQVFGLARAADGSFALTGVFQGTTGFGTGARRQLLSSAGWGDLFVVRYNADGDL